jgi:tellurite methyltransferase
MENSFWDKHYQAFAVHEPSRFAQFCLKNYIEKDDIVIELGCGNGRDGTVLGQFSKKYVGFDACPIAVNAFRSSLATLSPEHQNKIQIEVGDFTQLDLDKYAESSNRLVIYSRFSLHSIGYEDAQRLLDNISKIKSTSWVLLLEARTIFDTLYGQGENIGLHEFKTDHYRRFIDPQVFLQEIAAKFNVTYFEVNSGFAPFGNQDPLIMRAVMKS